MNQSKIINFTNTKSRVFSLVDNLSKASKRTMYTTRNIANKAVNMNLIRKPILENNRSYTVYRAYKLKTPEAKKFATDGTGVHVAQSKSICTENDCENKSCKTPCNDLKEIAVNGYYTHKPPNNSQSEHLSPVDFKGNQKDQHFVKSTTKPVITAQEAKDLTENDMHVESIATTFSVSSQAIFDKIK